MSGDFEFAPLFQRLAFILGTLSFFIGGSYFFVRSWHSLRQRVLHLDLPISLGLIAAYAGSVVAWTRGEHGFVYFDFVATFTFLMLAGRWLQQKAVERNRHQLLAAQAEPSPVRLASGKDSPSFASPQGTSFPSNPVTSCRCSRDYVRKARRSAWNGSAVKARPPARGADDSFPPAQ